MRGRLSAAVPIATFVLVVVMLTTGARALQSEAAASAGVGCAYLSDSGFSTLVVSVESTGLDDPPVTRGMSCAAAVKELMDRGFGFVALGPEVAGDYNQNGIVDAADYVMWRQATTGRRQSRPGTIVITACTHFNGAEPRTELTGVESAGTRQPPVITGLTCAAAVNALMDRGFVQVYKGPTVSGDFDGDGDVDGRDFLAWRR
jgi:hypothetical protein